jgi:hypothetical protein
MSFAAGFASTFVPLVNDAIDRFWRIKPSVKRSRPKRRDV